MWQKIVLVENSKHSKINGITRTQQQSKKRKVSPPKETATNKFVLKKIFLNKAL